MSKAKNPAAVQDQAFLKSVKEEFTCFVCFELFSTERNDPMLPYLGKCGHCFCKNCIMNCMKREKEQTYKPYLSKAQCPVCKTKEAFDTYQLMPNMALCRLFETLPNCSYVARLMAADEDISERIQVTEEQKEAKEQANKQAREKRVALEFVGDVQLAFAGSPTMCQTFLQEMGKMGRGKSGSNEELAAIVTILEMLKGHQDLLSRFYQFMPSDRITVQKDGSVWCKGLFLGP